MKLIGLMIASLLCTSVYAADNQNISEATGGQPQMQSAVNAATQNKLAGEAFLEKNKAQPDVVTLPDGLQYKILVPGTGVTPTENDTVIVHYAGTLINGTEFDSSYKRGQPAIFKVSGVIPGWVEALKLMKIGSVWELYIPSNLAYGEQGAPPSIGPNETLIFKVQLIGITQ